MSAGWVYEIAPGAAGKWSVALPDNFVNVPEVYVRDAEEAEFEKMFEAEESAAYEQEILDAESADGRNDASGA